MHLFVLPADVREEIVSRCRAEYPNEACGLIAGKREGIAETVFHLTNTEKSPISYFMDPREQFVTMKRMREEGRHMVAIYHSHPCSDAYPSPKDVSLAFYSDVCYLIVGLTDQENPVVRAFRIEDGRVSEAMIRTHAPDIQG